MIIVPPGTVLKNPDTGEVIKDFCQAGEEWVFLKGGRGGQGNKHFATATRQTPRFATPGKPGSERRVLVELRFIADIGLVGLPNAGKSTLLSRLTNAHPKIGSYPFTTKIPNLGAMHFHDHDIIVADIPGIIEGAAQGAGLGIRFLKHISRTELLAFLVDLSEPDFLQAPHCVEREMASFALSLIDKRRFIVGTKLDIADAPSNLDKLKAHFPDDTVIGISAVTGVGLDECRQLMQRLMVGD